MKILTIVIALFGLLFVGFLYLKYRLNNAPDSRDLMASIDLEVDKFKKKASSPIAVGVYKNSEIFIKAYGVSAPNESAIFQIGSVSKLITASLLTILCDEKVVRMESTLDELIGQQYPLSPEAKSVTLHQLVTHTTGFPKVPKALMDIANKKAGENNLMNNPYSHITFTDVLDYLETTEGKRKPGNFEYSNLGMGLLGHVLEIKTL